MRGQVSLEFIIIFSVAILTMATLFVIGAAQLEDAADARHLAEVNDIATVVQQELITAATVHDGYSRTFRLPQDIANKPYTFSVQNSSNVTVVTVEWKQMARSVRVPLFNGTLQPGRNTIMKIEGGLQCN